MAKLMLPDGWALRGTSNGNTYSINHYGAYKKTKSNPINPSTSFQAGVRANFTSISQSWKGLTQAQRNGWNATAKNYQTQNVFGKTFNYTGFNLYVQLNRNLATVGIAAIINAPQPVAVDSTMLSTVNITVTVPTVTLTYTPAISVATSIAVYATAPLSQGKNYFTGLYRKIHTLTSADASPFNAQAQYITKFGAIPPVGSKVSILFKNIDEATGNAGSETSADDISTLV